MANVPHQKTRAGKIIPEKKNWFAMIDPIVGLEALGIKAATLVAGFSGGLAFYYLQGSKEVKTSRLARVADSLVSGFLGSVMAVYIAPLGLLWFRIPSNELEIQTGAGFLVGMTGIYIGHGIIRLAAGWSKKPTIPKRD